MLLISATFPIPRAAKGSCLFSTIQLLATLDRYDNSEHL